MKTLRYFAWGGIAFCTFEIMASYTITRAMMCFGLAVVVAELVGADIETVDERRSASR